MRKTREREREKESESDRMKRGEGAWKCAQAQRRAMLRWAALRRHYERPSRTFALGLLREEKEKAKARRRRDENGAM